MNSSFPFILLPQPRSQIYLQYFLGGRVQFKNAWVRFFTKKDSLFQSIVSLLTKFLSHGRLLVTEQAGKACRDDSVEGLRFYPNLFLDRRDWLNTQERWKWEHYSNEMDVHPFNVRQLEKIAEVIATSTSWKNQIAFKIGLRLREARRFVIHFSWWIKEYPTQCLFVSLSCSYSVQGNSSPSKTGLTFKACLATPM